VAADRVLVLLQKLAAGGANAELDATSSDSDRTVSFGIATECEI
jgi:hypothetical protein